MILGIGTDIVSVARMQESMDRWGEERFARRLLSDSEYVLYNQTAAKAHFLAKRFAGKEAAVKALGTGFRFGLSLKDVQLVNDDLGKPLLKFYGKAAEIAEDKAVGFTHVSLSDEDAYATAFVVLERINSD